MAVPFDAVADLESKSLAWRVPVFRGAAIDAVVAVGTDAATLVSLLQAPDASEPSLRRSTIGARGPEIRSYLRVFRRSQVHLKVDGHIDVRAIADFLAAALKDNGS